MEQQEKSIRTWCAENNLVLAKIYADKAAPGSSAIGRKAFQEMIAHFHEAKCSEAGVVIWKYSRFARDIDDAQYFRSDLRRRGYILYSINDPIPEGLDGRLFEAAIDWMNARYLADLSVDIKRGQHHLVTEHGALGGTPPRGFKRDEKNIGVRRDGRPHVVNRWVPDPDQWERCRRAWELRARGVSYRAINDELHLFGSLNSYTTFFINRLYLGELVFGEEVIHNYCEPLIDQVTWDQVQEVNQHVHAIQTNADNPDHPRRKNSSFLLSGLAYCAQCGAILNGETVAFRKTAGYRYEYYACSGQNRGTGCQARKIPKPILEKAVLETLADFVLQPDTTARRQKDIIQAQQEYFEKLAQERSDINRKLGSLQRRIENLMDIMADKGKEAASLVTKLNELEAEQSRLKSDLAALNHRPLPKANDVGSQVVVAAKVVERMLAADPADVRTVIHGLISKIVAERDDEEQVIRGKVTYWLPPETETAAGSETDSGGFMPMRQCPRRDSNSQPQP